MNDTEQPIPPSNESMGQDAETGQAQKAEDERAKTMLGKLGSLMGGSKKAKIIILMFGVSIALIVLLVIIALIRRPPSDGVPAVVPTAGPLAPTPTPEPEETRDEINELMRDINEFDPQQSDLQPPVVDLEIGL